jgi:hypothetical protein
MLVEGKARESSQSNTSSSQLSTSTKFTHEYRAQRSGYSLAVDSATMPRVQCAASQQSHILVFARTFTRAGY